MPIEATQPKYAAMTGPRRSVWLRPNRRFLWLASIYPLILFGLGLVLLTGVIGGSPVWQVAGSVIAVPSGAMLLTLAWLMSKSRLTFDRVHRVLCIDTLDPFHVIKVPIDVVEGFLLGQSPSFLPGKRFSRAETSTVVIKLAERAQEWERREVRRQWGTWCGHYVTIRGTWCEPLNVPLIMQLNAALAEAKSAT